MHRTNAQRAVELCHVNQQRREFGSSATYYSADGRVVNFTLTGTPGQAQNGENTMYRLKLAYDPAVSQWVLTSSDQSKMTFNSSGVLQSVKDASGVTTTLTHAGGLLTRVTDAAGRQLTLTYSGTQLQYVKAPSFFDIEGTTSTGVIREWKLEYNTVTRVFEGLRSPRTAYVF